MTNSLSIRLISFLKILLAILLFLICLTVFLYGVSWAVVLLISLPQYAWTDVDGLHYKTFILLLIPTLLCGLWWAIYVTKNQNMIVINKTKSFLLEPDQYKEIYQKISLVAMTLNIPMPKIYFTNDTGINSLLVSNTKKESALIFSSHVIEKNDLDIIQNMAVFHLLDVQSRKNAFKTYVVALTTCFSILFEALMKRVFKKKAFGFRLEKIQILLYPLRFVLLPLLAILIIFALYDRLIAPVLSLFCSPKDIFTQDKNAIKILQAPSKYINTLYMVQDNPRVLMFENGATFISCFQDPTNHLGLFKLAGCHPTIEERIHRIKSQFKVYFIYEKEEK